MTLAENLGDLIPSADDLGRRIGLSDTVLAPGGEDATVIGCLCTYPGERAAFNTDVSSWVRAADADVDAVLDRVVTRWLDDAWPFERVEYAVRPE